MHRIQNLFGTLRKVYLVLSLVLFFCTFTMASNHSFLKHEPDCIPPSAIRLMSYSSSHLAFSWNGEEPSYNGIRHQARFRQIDERGEGSWNYVWLMEYNHLRLDNLIASMKYEVELRRICDGSGYDYTLSSDWVPVASIQLDGEGSEAEEYTGEQCDALLGGTVNELGSGLYLVQLNVTTPPTATGTRYMIRHRSCASGSIWVEEFLLTGDSITIQDLSGAGMCQVEARVIMGGSGTTYQYYCPWQSLYNVGGPGTVGSSGCGNENNVVPPQDIIPLDSLYVNDLVTVAGIPFTVTAVSGGSGVFTGEGEMLLPVGNKHLAVEFFSIKINQHYEVFEGDVKGIAGPSSNYPHLQPNQNPSVQFECLERKSRDGFDENGIWIATGLPYDPFGFDKDGNYVLTPPYPGYQQGDPHDPNYDPNGFDSDGNHVLTGSKYNENGCSRDSIDRNGEPCDPGADPYYWMQNNSSRFTQHGKEFYENIKDSLRAKIIETLNGQKDEFTLALEDQSALCDLFRDTLDQYIIALGYPEDRIKGSSMEYFDDGLSNNFESEPQEVLDDFERSPDQEGLEQTHVKLYNCDKSYAEIQRKIDLVLVLLTPEELDALEEQLASKIKSFSQEEAEKYENDTEFTTWLINEILAIIDSRLGTTGFQFENFQKSLEDGLLDNLSSASVASRELSLVDDVNLTEETWMLLWSNNKFIHGIHRAFYLEEIGKQRRSMLAAPPSGGGTLPVILTNEKSGRNFHMYLDNITLNQDGGTLDVYFILDIPTSGDRVVFSAIGVTFGPGGAFTWDQLKLNSDFEIRLNNAANLIIKGSSGGTFINWNCEGYQGVGIDAEIEFCRQYLTPVDLSTNTVISDPQTLVKAYFQAQMQSWGELVAQINMDPFAVTKFESVFWNVTAASMDFSDLSSPDFPIPPDYESNFVENGVVKDQWKGFYLAELSASLPQGFNNSGDPVQFGVYDVIIDDMGFSGYGELNTTILPLSEGSVGGWAFSIDGINVQVVSNEVVGAGFNGKVNVPIFKGEGNGGSGVAPEDCFDYSAQIYAGNLYSFDISPGSEYDVDIWKAKVSISANSQASIVVEDGEFTASANLHGKVIVDGDITQKMKLSVPDVPFQNVVISNKSPYFSPGTWDLPNKVGAKLGGFQISMEKVALVAGEESNECQLQFKSRINFSNDFTELGGEVGVGLIGKLTEGNHQKWDYDRLKITDIGINCDIKGNKIAGVLSFFENGGVYGDGFRGIVDVQFSAMGGAASGSIKALGQFGKVTDSSGVYKYFLVDAVGKWSPGTPIVPGLNLCGISGGLWYKMNRPENPTYTFNNDGLLPPIGSTLSGVQYTPTPDPTLGFKVGAVLSVGEESVFNANVNFGCEFNFGGGMNQIFVEGNAQFMADIDFGNGTQHNEGQPPANNAEINANFGMTYDFRSSNFSGNLEAYANAAGGAFRGGGPLNRLGWADIHFGNGSWKIWLGTPQNPWKAKVDLAGIVQADVHAYLCVGSILPELGELPDNVTNVVGDFDRKSNIRGAGAKGFMFGTGFNVGTGDLEFMMFYASLNAGLGMDISILNYGGLQCEQTLSGIGINGWYAAGSIYGYVQGKIGINAKVFGRKKKFNIINLEAAYVLEGGLPNPFFAQGAVGGKYEILGGLIRGNCDFKFAIGEPCSPIGGSGDVELKAVQEIVPNQGATFVSTESSIRVIMNAPIGHSYNVTEVSGQTSEFMLTVDDSYTSISYDGIEIPFTKRILDDGYIVEFIPQYLLPELDSLTFKFKVKIDEVGQGTEYEEHTIGFHTGTALDFIPESNVKWSYPIAGQSHFHPETNYRGNGMVVLERAQPDLTDPHTGLLEATFKWKGGEASVPVNVVGPQLSFLIPDLPLNKEMSLEIFKHKEQEGGGLQGIGGQAVSLGPPPGKVVYSCDFKTSSYASFADKAAVLKSNGFANLQGSIIEIKSYALTEGFDEQELTGLGDGPLVQIKPVLSASTWFSREVYTKLYSQLPFQVLKEGDGVFKTMDIKRRKKELYGAPPTSNLIGDVTEEGPFKMDYLLYNIIKTDYQDLRSQAMTLIMELDRNDFVVRNFAQGLSNGPPSIIGESVQFELVYNLPGGNQTSRTLTFTVN